MTASLQIPPPNAPLMASDGTVTLQWRTFFEALISRAGGVLGGLQPADPTLDALAALNASAGLVVEVSADTFTKRSLAGVAGHTVVTNPTGSAGNPTVDLAPVAGVAGIHAAPASITVDGFGRITAIS